MVDSVGSPLLKGELFSSRLSAYFIYARHGLTKFMADRGHGSMVFEYIEAQYYGEHPNAQSTTLVFEFVTVYVLLNSCCSN